MTLRRAPRRAGRPHLLLRRKDVAEVAAPPRERGEHCKGMPVSCKSGIPYKHVLRWERSPALIIPSHRAIDCSANGCATREPAKALNVEVDCPERRDWLELRRASADPHAANTVIPCQCPSAPVSMTTSLS